MNSEEGDGIGEEGERKGEGGGDDIPLDQL
jgi:hypothetical protein